MAELRPWMVTDERPGPEALAVTAEQARLLARCCSGLTVRQRQLLVLHYQDGHNWAQIALRWQVSEAAVCQMHGRLLVRLRGSLAALRITRLDEVA
ncbi:MAG: hypothetical protein MUF01_02420 [Bryobacterales bacterium]|nr:hypothetical protein [Bryobacterales bacterium]